MIDSEKNLYISNDFDFLNEGNVSLDKERFNIFFTDTNISAQLKNNKIIYDIYNSDIIKLSFGFEDIKNSIHEKSYYDIINIIKEYISTPNQDEYKSISEWKTNVHFLINC